MLTPTAQKEVKGGEAQDVDVGCRCHHKRGHTNATHIVMMENDLRPESGTKTTTDPRLEHLVNMRASWMFFDMRLHLLNERVMVRPECAQLCLTRANSVFEQFN